MKKLILSLLVVAGVSSALAQGTVTFITFNSNTARGQTFLPDGTTQAGSPYVAQLLWSDTSNGTFVSSGAPVGLVGGYVNGPAVDVPGHLGGEVVFLTMQVWDGPTFPSALSGYANTPAISRTLGGINVDGDPVPPQQFNTFANLTLTPVPEPGTIVLAGLGLASLLIFRRRK
jgi:hypothetical protein